MEHHDRIGHRATAWGLAAGISIFLSAVLVVVKETNEATVLAWMKAATVHHWMTHALLTLALFVVLGVGLSRLGGADEGLRMRGGTLAGLIVALYVAGGLLVAGFFALGG